MAFLFNDSYNIISRRISNVGISFTQTDRHTDTQTHRHTGRQFNFFPSLTLPSPNAFSDRLDDASGWVWGVFRTIL
jgi:hypothetical protein